MSCSFLCSLCKDSSVCVAETAPEAVLKALQGPVQEALQHAQDEDRARSSAAAEALSGLVACSKIFTSLTGQFRHLIQGCVQGA